MSWRRLYEGAEWDEDVTAIMDNLARSLVTGNAGLVTTTSIGADARPIFMYSVALVGEVIVGVVIDCGTESNILWAMQVP